MFLKQGLILTLQRSLKIDSLFHILPFEWDEDKEKFRITNTLSSRFWRVAAFLFLTVTGTLMLLSSWRNKSSLDMMEICQMLMAALIFLFGGSILWMLHQEHLSVVGVLNGLVQIEEELEQDDMMSPQDSRTILLNWIGKLLVMTGKYYAIFVPVGAGIAPQFPTNAFAIYSWNEEAWNYTGWHLLYRNMWLKVKNGYDRLRLLVQIFNNVHAKGIIVHLLILLAVGQVLSLYCVIRCVGLPLLNLVTLLFLGFNSYIEVIGVYGCAGEVHGTSKYVRASLKRKSKVVKGNLAQKSMNSLPDLRIRFGSVNFIEVTTPLEFIDFTSSRLVDMLLFSR
ncbi:unnamed protein product [Orchesella dallaii]|uniref:Odorant receptor n=1 Tax=Orchesella dallaii TaxID=48710 RepID=A0ABP1R665_9HEXA